MLADGNVAKLVVYRKDLLGVLNNLELVLLLNSCMYKSEKYLHLNHQIYYIHEVQVLVMYFDNVFDAKKLK